MEGLLIGLSRLRQFIELGGILSWELGVLKVKLIAGRVLFLGRSFIAQIKSVGSISWARVCASQRIERNSCRR
jgi:hypothetical protein